MPPSLEPESALWSKGYRFVAGIDEAGRGCLAGPVFAAAVILPEALLISGVNDSKKLSPARREKLLAEIQASAVAVGVGLCTPEEIDKLNILWAAMEAMRRAVTDLTQRPDYLLIDGNRCFESPPCPAAPLIKGDMKSVCIAAASIVAKTARDRLMQLLHEEYPVYGWARNKGYPTADHYAALSTHGPSPYHRKTFRLTPPGERYPTS